MQLVSGDTADNQSNAEETSRYSRIRCSDCYGSRSDLLLLALELALEPKVQSEKILKIL